ncbi:MAG: lysophospholipid acyltransferase family protein [Labilithrix sp.]|nr:lysophospholipid acyltransferase family protein [Labilithrix sp.]
MSDAGVRDLREGGRWSIPQRAKNDVLFVLAIAALAVAERLPPRAARALGRAAGLLAWALAPALRRTATRNVARALPEIAPRDRGAFVRRVFDQLGALLGEVVGGLDPRRPLDPLPFLPGSRECLDDAIREGRGVVFASAHLGPWERVAASLVAAGIPLTVVAREPYDPRLGRVYSRLRAARGVRAVYRGASGAGVALVRVLRQGDVLGVPMDLSSRVASIEAPFLGAPAPTPIGPARLAVRTGAAVVVGTAAKGADGSLGLSFTRIEGSASEVELTARINAELSARIRAMPESWPWMHRRWPDA